MINQQKKIFKCHAYHSFWSTTKAWVGWINKIFAIIKNSNKIEEMDFVSYFYFVDLLVVAS